MRLASSVKGFTQTRGLHESTWLPQRWQKRYYETLSVANAIDKGHHHIDKS